MKWTTYFMIFYFSLGACIPKCDFGQLLKISDLVGHYELHQEEALAIGKTISFSDFLYQHFFADEHHQHDSNENHDNLPLQNITTTVLSITPPQSLHISIKQAFKNTLPSYHSFYRNTITFDIFHPPQLA